MSMMYRDFQNVKIRFGNKVCDAYPVNYTLRDSTEHLPRLEVEYIIADEIRVEHYKSNDLYPLVYLGIGIIVFCLIWSL